jgi:hypothetical protein
LERDEEKGEKLPYTQGLGNFILNPWNAFYNNLNLLVMFAK